MEKTGQGDSGEPAQLKGKPHNVRGALAAATFVVGGSIAVVASWPLHQQWASMGGLLAACLLIVVARVRRHLHPSNEDALPPPPNRRALWTSIGIGIIVVAGIVDPSGQLRKDIGFFTGGFLLVFSAYLLVGSIYLSRGDPSFWSR